MILTLFLSGVLQTIFGSHLFIVKLMNVLIARKMGGLHIQFSIPLKITHEVDKANYSRNNGKGSDKVTKTDISLRKATKKIKISAQYESSPR